MLPDSGSIQRGVHFWKVLFAFMLSPGWTLNPTPQFSILNADPAIITSQLKTGRLDVRNKEWGQRGGVFGGFGFEGQS